MGQGNTTSLFDPADYTARELSSASGWLSTMLGWTIEPVVADTLAVEPVASSVARLRAVIDSIDSGAPDPVTIGQGFDLLQELGRQLHEVGAGAPTQQGVVVQINTSDGGVPKTAVPSADVGRRGLLGDRQENRKHHGRPFQALCLWSADVIEALRGEGHPIVPGAAGENLTLSGIDWSTLRPGVRLLIGQVLCEVSAWAEPCRHNDQWFTERSDRIDHALHPGWSRAYAWVLEPGEVTTGDVVIVEP